MGGCFSNNTIILPLEKSFQSNLSVPEDKLKHEKKFIDSVSVKIFLHREQSTNQLLETVKVDVHDDMEMREFSNHVKDMILKTKMTISGKDGIVKEVYPNDMSVSFRLGLFRNVSSKRGYIQIVNGNIYLAQHGHYKVWNPFDCVEAIIELPS